MSVVKPQVKLAAIRWRDAATRDQSGPREAIVGLVDLVSVGVFVEQTPEYIAIAMEYDRKENDGRFYLTIPMVNVTDIHIFEEPKRRKDSGRRTKTTTGADVSGGSAGGGAG